MKKLYISSLVILTFLLFIDCNTHKDQPAASGNPALYSKNGIRLENLEILNANTGSNFNFSSLALLDIYSWKPVKIPFVNKSPGPFSGPLRSFWIRGDFTLTAYEKELSPDTFVFDLGWATIWETVYVNDRQIGKIDWIQLDKFFKPKYHILPVNLKLQEKNKVYIQFITADKLFTFLSDFRILEYTNFERINKRRNFLYNQLPIGFILLFLVLVAVFVRQFIYSKNKRYLFYILFILCECIPLFIIYSPVYSKLIVATPFVGIVYALYAIYLLLFIYIFQSMYGIYFTRQNIISSVLLVFVSIATLVHIRLIVLNKINFNAYFFPVLFIIIPAVIYYIFLLHSLNLHKLDNHVKRMAAVLLISIVIVNLILIPGIILNIWYVKLNNIWATAIYSVIIIIFEAGEAKKKRLKLERVYKMLERNGSPALTESAEQKIDRVMNFINENYKYAISREGLASAVDMSANYMGRLFMLHTGKKVGEYINHLRIADAARQLRETDNGEKIEDIAQSMGFESMTTFNRLFKSSMGVTPTEYRKK